MFPSYSGLRHNLTIPLAAPVTFRSKSSEELLRLFKDQQTVDHWRRITEGVYGVPPAPVIQLST